MSSPLSGMTPEQVIRRALLDFPFYCENFLMLEAKNGEMVPFKLNEAQLIVYRVWKAQEDAGLPVRALILKGRQQGMSSAVQAWLAWKAFTRSSRCFTIGHKLGPAGELFGKIETFYEHLPPEFKPYREAKRGGRRLRLKAYGTDGKVKLRSLLVVESAEDDETAGRSGTFAHVHMTEVPFWKNQDTTISAIEACVPYTAGTSINVESTARGRGNWFHQKWVECIRQLEAGETPEFYPIFVPWFATPEYADEWVDGTPAMSRQEKAFQAQFNLSREQVLWYRRQKRKHGELVAQEYPCTWEEAFLSSGLPFFRPLDMERLENAAPDPIRKGEIVKAKKGYSFEPTINGKLHVFRLPDKGHSYVIGGDVAGGRAKDFSFAQVLDVDTMEQVASWQGKLDPADFAYVMACLGRMYRGRDDYALLVPERNGVGGTTVHVLTQEINYPNLYQHERLDTITGEISNEIGWTTSVRTRPVMLEDFQHAIAHDEIKINCRRTLAEMASFVYTDDTGKKAVADTGCNDDAVMSISIAYAGRHQAGGEIEFDVADDTFVGVLGA